MGVDKAKKAVQTGSQKVKKAIGATHLDAKSAQKTLDQLVNDYGMGAEYANIDFTRPMPYPGYAAAAPVYGAEYQFGEFPYAAPAMPYGDFYGAYAAPAAFIY